MRVLHSHNMFFACALLFSACGMEQVKNPQMVYDQPEIYPDYRGVTIPVNIAPLDFTMQSDSVLMIDAVFTGSGSGELHAQGRQSTCIDSDEWQKLLQKNQGGSLFVQVAARFPEGWRSYTPFGIDISPDSIDYGITYRLIDPGYEAYTKMGIYETRLSDSRERALIENTQFRGCVNCHSYLQGDPRYMSLHVRGDHGATLISHPGENGEMKAYNTKTQETLGFCVYPYWHPSGRYIAYSTNNTRQGFHVGGHKIIEVMDLASDMQVYDVANNQLLVCEALKGDSAFETFPAFSPDGRTLYFSVARPKNYPTELKEMYYSLCSIAFDPESGTYGTRIDTLVNGEALRKSAVYARPSYDGRFLCYTMADYGYFHIWHAESDLWLMDLQTGESRPMTEANSPDTESVHSWSSNSRWLVFGSRRDDGQYTRPYFCHVAEDGTVGKAFMLPQRNPRQFYDRRFMSYNIPEFVTAPVPLDNKLAEKQIVSDQRVQMGVVRNR